jgi:murein DD-endopeptidase MepM/ murein hydrolase activator NlpD
MRQLALVVGATAVLASLLTAVLYQPLSLLLFKVSEPYFKYPIKTEGPLIIRKDELGSGAYGASRASGRMHDGIDILAPVGTPVHAAKSGIAFCLNVPSGYGKYVMLYHPDRTQSLYAHLSDYNVISTQKVRQGDVIGFVGKTGNAGAMLMHPHLHFEVRKNAVTIDPKPLMRR